jgi:hypothetical protein
VQCLRAPWKDLRRLDHAAIFLDAQIGPSRRGDGASHRRAAVLDLGRQRVLHPFGRVEQPRDIGLGLVLHQGRRIVHDAHHPPMLIDRQAHKAGDQLLEAEGLDPQTHLGFLIEVFSSGFFRRDGPLGAVYLSPRWLSLGQLGDGLRMLLDKFLCAVGLQQLIQARVERQMQFPVHVSQFIHFRHAAEISDNRRQQRQERSQADRRRSASRSAAEG